MKTIIPDRIVWLLTVTIFVAIIRYSQARPNKCAERSSYVDPTNCQKFFQCVHGNPVPRECPPGTVFNEEIGVCVHVGSQQDTCSDQATVITTEGCAEGSSYADSTNCQKYFKCVHGTPLPVNCPAGTAFNEDLGMCVDTGSEQDKCTRDNPVRECDLGNADYIPHAKLCHHYFNCSIDTESVSQYSPLDKYESECQYPFVFDVRFKKCMNYTQAVCGEGRQLYKWQCDYDSNKCWRSHCRPCSVDTPSCINKPDGQIALPYILWSPYYCICKDERNIGKQSCANHNVGGMRMPRLFHPELRRCVSLWKIPTEHGGLQPTCKGKSPGFYAVQQTPLMTYKCPGAELLLCKKPIYIDSDISKCQPFDS